MSEFEKLVKSRRSAMNFIEGVEISEKELEEIFNLVKLAPSCFNLQHAKYLVITDKELKQKFYEQASPQYKIITSSALILVLGNKKAYEDAGKIYEGLKMLGIITPEEYTNTVQTIHNSYVGNGESFQRDEAIRNACLSAMLFMMVAKDKGWDTCPMIGFNPLKATEILSIPDHLVPALMITLGKEDSSKIRQRGYRKPVREFVSYNNL